MSAVIFFNSQETAGQPISCPNDRTRLNREQVSLHRLIFACMTLIWLKIRKRPRGGWGGAIEGEKTKVMQQIKNEEKSIFN